jgi:hypothetical protein
MTNRISQASVEARASHIEHCYGVGHMDAVMLRELVTALSTARGDALLEASNALLIPQQVDQSFAAYWSGVHALRHRILSLIPAVQDIQE